MKTTIPHLCPFSNYDRIFPGDPEWEKCECEEGEECLPEDNKIAHCILFLMREMKKLNETIQKCKGKQ